MINNTQSMRLSSLLGYLQDNCHKSLQEANSRSAVGDLSTSRYHLGRSDAFAHIAEQLEAILQDGICRPLD